jgi:hypothetical protein
MAHDMGYCQAPMAPDVLLVRIAEGGPGHFVGSQTICRDRFGESLALLRLLQKSQRRRIITGFGNKAIEDFTLVTDGASLMLHMAIDVDCGALRVTLISSCCQRQWLRPFVLDAR